MGFRGLRNRDQLACIRVEGRGDVLCLKLNDSAVGKFARGLMEDRKNEGETLQMMTASQTPRPTSDLGANSAIGKRLKAYYDDVASEPVPDRFLSLLDALDAAESASKRPDRE